MNVIEKLKQDQLQARKEKNKFLSGILTTLIGEIISVGKNNGNRETTNDEAVKVIEKFKKNAEQTCTLMSDSGADSKEMESYIEEISIYNSYLPKQMNTEELTSLIKDIIDHDSQINMGKIMKFLKSQYAGQYDGKEASQIAKKLLP
jgi:hypothetical protein